MKKLIKVGQIKSLIKEVKSAHNYNSKQAYEWLLKIISRNGYETGVQDESTVLGFIFKQHCNYTLKRHPLMHGAVISFKNKETNTIHMLTLYELEGKLVAL
jgi:hypothetical protein